jgi:hypothetical protein
MTKRWLLAQGKTVIELDVNLDVWISRLSGVLRLKPVARGSLRFFRRKIFARFSRRSLQTFLRKSISLRKLNSNDATSFVNKKIVFYKRCDYCFLNTENIEIDDVSDELYN